MTRGRSLHARATRVARGIEELGFATLWGSLVGLHAERMAAPSSARILAGLGARDPAWADDVLAGLTMSEISALYEFSLASFDHQSRKSSGQFFTPDDVARFLAARAAAFPPGMWIDPCCGVGNLSWWLAAAQPDPQEFLAERLILVDRDPIALGIACALLALGFERDREIYGPLMARAVHGDSLTTTLPAYDFAILNPPYVRVPRDGRFDAADARDLCAYFIERMLRDGSGIVAISPQSFTSGTSFAAFRRMLVRRLAEMDVYCFDNVPDTVFRGVKFGSQNSNRANSTRAAVLVGRVDGASRRRITPLMRWRAPERDELLATADRFLAELHEDVDRAFAKVEPDLVPLHRELLGCATTLGDLLTRERTAHHLDVPSTPRYFLSAVRRPLERSSTLRIHFRNAADRDRAYLVLNSSLAYWWWRVYDGGIILGRKLLAGLPIPIPSAPPDLLDAVARSEADNLVVKLNAGRQIENVKHPPSLLRRLNAAVAPGYADRLLAVHANSHLSSSHLSSASPPFGG